MAPKRKDPGGGGASSAKPARGRGAKRQSTRGAAAADEGEDEISPNQTSPNLMGRRVRKRFGKQWFEGVVESQDEETEYYLVKYEDGDEEEMEEADLRKHLVDLGLSAAAEVVEISDSTAPTTAAGGAARGEEPGEAAQSPAPAPAPAARRGGQGPVARRRERDREVARGRAAHFAFYNQDADAGGGGGGGDVNDDDEAGVVDYEEGVVDLDGLHAGGERARGLGPWSTARELVKNRAAAQARRKEQIAEEARAAEEAEVAWEPRRPMGFVSMHAKSSVPSLRDICIKLTCDNIQHVATLEGMPDDARNMVASGLAARRELTGEVLPLFSGGRACELVIPDCTQVDEKTMTSALRECAGPRLEALELRFCGRGLSDKAVASTWGAGGPEGAGPAAPNLARLTLSGAYRLSDAGVASVLAAAPKLVALELSHSQRLTAGGVRSLGAVGSSLRSLVLDGCVCLGDGELTEALSHLPLLESLSLRELLKLTDATVQEVAVARGAQLLELRLARSTGVTDAGISAVAACCPRLQALEVDGLQKATAEGIARVAEGCRELRELSVRHCRGIKGSDGAAALSAVAKAAGRGFERALLGSCPAVNNAVLTALTSHCSESLTHVDLSFCRDVSDNAVGALLDACWRMQTLEIWGCSQVTSRLLRGHSNEGVLVTGAPQATLPAPSAAV